MKKCFKNKKGFTLTEILLALLIVGLISGLITEMLGFHISASTAFSRYNRQQFTVQDALTRLNRDIEAAVKVTVDPDDLEAGNKCSVITLDFTEGSYRQWRFTNNGSLCLDDQIVVEGLTSDSTFIYGSDYLTVVLMPAATNQGKHNINVSKPLVAQYNLTYKQ